ncbi:MAG: CHAT domain-containing protein, partial [Ardenticatenales bacterium]|nr:CHAT domain-containing protein [Ardenticatenales bacterium]
MAVHLTIRVTDDGMLVASHQGDVLAEGTPFAALRRIERKADNRESNPYRTAPFELGQTLYAAMGGEALWTRLNEDTDGLLLLDCDLQSGTIPWEYAVTPARHWLVARFGFLRYLPDAPAARPAPDGPLNLVVLAADPLVAERDKKLYALDPFLDIETELKAIEATVAASGQALTAQRIPPTKQSLQSALRHRAPALLHLSCHGNVIPVERNGQTVYEALLQLEDADGKAEMLMGDQLRRLAPAGVLRLVVMSACRTAASALDADLARALVSGGVPAAVGMQGNFDDPLSDDLAAALYESLLAGWPLSEALRQARLALADRPDAIGLAVGYVSAVGDTPLPLRAGPPRATLQQTSRLSLPNNVQAPQPFVGRDGELHGLARCYSTGHKVVTVVGTGGIGKTALAARFAERFGWRWRGGVIGVSLAQLANLEPLTVVRELLGRLLPPPQLAALADATLDQWEELLLKEAQSADCLIIVDNYESVLQAISGAADPELAGEAEGPTAPSAADLRQALDARFSWEELRTLAQDVGIDHEHLAGDTKPSFARELVAACEQRGLITTLLTEAQRQRPTAWPAALHPARDEQGRPLSDETERNAARLHRVVATLAQGGVDLLLTSRRHPAGLAGEFLFPPHALDGVGVKAGASLFIHLSSRAKQAKEAQALAEQVATVTEGHPLAIALLAAEWDLSTEIEAEDFLANWDEELAAARRPGMAAHHVTFATAFRRSFDHLTEAQQQRLVALRRFPAPFFAEGAALLWQGELPADDAARSALRRELAIFVQRSLLRVDGWYVGGELPATYRLEPVIARALQRQPVVDEAMAQRRYLDYAAWLVRHLREGLNAPALVTLAQQWVDELIPLNDDPSLPEAGWFGWRLATLLYQFGRVGDALSILERIVEIALADEDQRLISLSKYDLAQVHVTRGELTQAMALYEASLAIREQVGDLPGKGATLHNMAQVHQTRGDLTQAMALYEESLAIREQVGDLKGKGATLSGMANI